MKCYSIILSTLFLAVPAHTIDNGSLTKNIFHATFAVFYLHTIFQRMNHKPLLALSTAEFATFIVALYD